MISKRSMLVTTAALLAGTWLNVAQADDTKLTVIVFPGVQNLPMFAAQQKGFFAKRGLAVDHSTVWRWVQHYAPMLNQQLRRELRQTNRSWRVDDTYIRVAGRWTYLYRAVDKEGKTVDSLFQVGRGIAAAMAFFRKAVMSCAPRWPWKITLDGPYPLRVRRALQPSRAVHCPRNPPTLPAPSGGLPA